MNVAHNPIFRYPFILILALNLLGGCAPPGELGQSLPVASQEPVSSEVQGAVLLIPDDRASDGEGEARFVDGPVEDVLGELPALGSITFTVDAAHQTNGVFAPGGTELKLSLTDAAGLTWMLTLPAGSLNTTETITMTALNNVHSNNIPGSMIGGVLLEPDGLWLIEPGTLAVTGGDLDRKALFLGGSRDGADVNFALPSMDGTGSKAVIQHFSSYTVIHSEDPKITELRELERQHYKELAKKGRELLKNKDIGVPHPPSIPLYCPKDEDEAEKRKEALKKFEEDFRNPEFDLLSQLIASQTSLSLVGVEPDFTLEVRLLERMIKKVNLLIKEYGNRAEYVSAITQVGYRVAYEIALIGPKDHAGSMEVMQALGRMSERVIEELMKELREEHEYRNVGPILDMARRAALVGMSTIPLEDILARMERVLQFQMKLNWVMGIEGESRFELQGEFPMRYQAKNMWLGSLTGSGKAEMISAKFESDEDWYVESAPFHVEAYITRFDACEAKVFLTINRFYPEVENHFTLDSDGEVMEIGPMPLMQIAWETLYEDRKGTGPSWYADGEVQDFYNFEFPLRNKDVIAIHDMIETMDASPDGILMGWLSAELTHTPK